MIAKPPFMSCALAAIALSACTQQPGEISRDTQPFDGIAETASVSASGTEPFWSLTVEPEQGRYLATYSTPENIEGTTFAAGRFAGNNGLGFSGEVDGDSAILALTPGECSDGMSGRTYPYTATLALGERTLLGCAYTSDEPFKGDQNP